VPTYEWNGGDKVIRFSDQPERIPLRACAVKIGEGDTRPGVALPDGRILFFAPDVAASYSCEAALLQAYPGALLTFYPDADEVINSG